MSIRRFSLDKKAPGMFPSTKGGYVKFEDHQAALAKLRQDVGLPATPRFAEVSCSQCGKSFGPGDGGFSHCEHHAHLRSHD